MGSLLRRCAFVVCLLPAVGVASEEGPGAPAESDVETPARSGETADAAAQRIVDATGDIYALSELAFTFIVESGGVEKVRRAHRRDWAAGTVTVELDGSKVKLQNLDQHDPSPAVADPTAHAEMWAAVGPDVPAPIAARAWATWINDSYWLLAPAKLMDAGVVRALDEQGRLLLQFDGVGVTPEDAYALVVEVKPDRIHAWEFRLQSGRKAHFTWSDYQTIGPLTLAMTRSNAAGDFIIRFEEVVPTP